MTKIGLIVVIVGLLFSVFGLFWWFGDVQDAVLKIETLPSAIVFINNKQLGQTPSKERLPAGEVSLKLIPISSSSAMPTYQTKLQLSPKAVMVINRDFGKTEAESSGSTLAPQKIAGSETRLVVVTSVPDLASVSVDANPLGFTPVSTSAINPGDHELLVSAPGYVDKKILFKMEKGYQLNVSVKLAIAVAAPTPTPIIQATSSANLNETIVLIKSTPTGFLRVRSGPGANYPELGKVMPKEKYPLLDKSADWYLIKVDIGATSSGWISSQWSQIQNSNNNSSPNSN